MSGFYIQRKLNIHVVLNTVFGVRFCSRFERNFLGKRLREPNSYCYVNIIYFDLKFIENFDDCPTVTEQKVIKTNNLLNLGFRQ